VATPHRRVAHTALPVAFILSLACAVSQAAQPAMRTVRDFGAVGNGKADDTAAIQRAVDASVGDVRLPRGVYRLTRPVVIDLDKVGWTSVCGTGAARLVMAGPGPALRLVGTHHGTAGPSSVKPNVWERQRMPIVDGIEIVGAHAQAVGIKAAYTMKLVISRVTIRETLHAIHLVKRNRNVIVSDCHLYHNRGIGLFLDAVDLHQINVTGCHISYNPAGGVVVRGGCVRNLHINGCDIEGNRFNVLIDSATSPVGTAEVAITGCTLQHSGGADSANIRFIGAAKTTGKGAARTWGLLTIASNVISDTQTNIDIQKAFAVSIVGNVLGSGYKHALRITDSVHVAVGPNVVDRNPKYRDDKHADNAVVLRGCDDCTLTGLHIARTRRAPAALVIDDCRRVNVTGCTIVDCDNAGILLRASAHCRISGCLVRNAHCGGQPWTPVVVTGGRGNMVAGNLLDAAVKAGPGSAHLSANVVEK